MLETPVTKPTVVDRNFKSVRLIVEISDDAGKQTAMSFDVDNLAVRFCADIQKHEDNGHVTYTQTGPTILVVTAVTGRPVGELSPQT